MCLAVISNLNIGVFDDSGDEAILSVGPKGDISAEGEVH